MEQFRERISRLRRLFVVRFVMEVASRFGRDNGALIAAGLAFFSVLTFVPLVLVAISACGYWLEFTHHSSRAAIDIIQGYITQNVAPGAAGREVRHLIERANIGQTVAHVQQTKGIAGLIGLLGIIWAAMQIYVSGSSAMNAAWETKETRNWFKLRVISLGLLVATGVLLVLSLGATAVGSWISRHLLFPGAALLVTLGTEAGAIVLSTLMYAIVYRYLPSGQSSWRSAFVAGAFAAVAWEIAKKGLAVYLMRPNHSLYGGLADLIIFVLWIYYSMMILLLGAEVGSTYTALVVNHRRTHLRRTAGATPSAAADYGTPPHDRKTRDQRIRKTGRSEGLSAERR